MDLNLTHPQNPQLQTNDQQQQQQQNQQQQQQQQPPYTLPGIFHYLQYQQNLARHQQLQKLLKAPNSQTKSSSSANASNSNTTSSSSSTSMTPSASTHRNDHHQQTNQQHMNHQRDMTLNSMSSLSNNHLPSPSIATISPPQPSASLAPNLPKSLLNLAAFTPPTSSSAYSSSSRLSSMLNDMTMRSSRNSSSHSSGSMGNLHRATNNYTNGTAGMSSDNIVPRQPTSSLDALSVLQQMPRSAMPSSKQGSSGSSRGNSSAKQLQMSLLSDDQGDVLGKTKAPSSSSLINPKLASQLNQSNSRHHHHNRDATLFAALQEMTPKSGINLADLARNSQSMAQSTQLNQSNPIMQQGPTNLIDNISSSSSSTNHLHHHTLKDSNDSFNTADRREIESALSRVGARNDLSLLYPPISIASSSQKQINALSAGLHHREDSEFFTKEVKRIVLEECNIIYECKECSNLFRSLANLVKHKRSYCLESSSDRNNNMERNRRPNAKPVLPMDQASTSLSNNCDPLQPQQQHHHHQPQQNLEFGSHPITSQSEISSDKHTTYLSRLLQSQPVRNSSLAKTLLNEKARLSTNPSQSLIELSKAEMSQIKMVPKRAAPKRKFLEDCIKKVKRDKLITEEEAKVEEEKEKEKEAEVDEPHPQPQPQQSSRSSSSLAGSSPLQEHNPAGPEDEPGSEVVSDDENMDDENMDDDNMDDDESDRLQVDEMENSLDEDEESQPEEPGEVTEDPSEATDEPPTNASSPELSTQASKSNSTTSSSTPSGSGAAGGLMKLKIQVKSRPDEKSKRVYEISKI